MMQSRLFCLLSLVFAAVKQASSYDWTEIYASDYAIRDFFGYSVGISGDLAVAGAYANDDQGTSSGSAYIFAKDSSSGDWTQEEKLLQDDGTAGDAFGYSVDISGNVAIIGSPNDDDDGANAGAAYIFTKDSSTGDWEQTTKLLAGDYAVAGIQCGSSVAISGDSAIMGCYASTTGYAFIFEYSNDEWEQTGVLSGGHYFGWSVAIYDSEYAIIGTYQDDTQATNAGAAFIYSKDSSTSEWSYTQALYASNAGENDYFGYSVSICDDYAIVGAIYEDTEASNAGSAYIFKRSSSTWSETQQLTTEYALTSAYFGYSVSLNCDSENYYAIIGANEDDTVANAAGAGYLFFLSTSNGDENWDETAQLITNQYAGDRLGSSVSASGNCLILGDPNHNDYTSENEGAAFIVCDILPSPNPTSNPTALPTPATTAAAGTCNSGSTAFSKSAELTPDDSTAEDGFASATLISNDNNVISDSQWQCTMPSTGDSMCIYLTISDSCECESVITITVEGDVISGDVDIFSIFSYQDNDGTDKFVTFATGWTDYFSTGDGERGGAFIAPYCGDELFSINDIFTLLDNVTLYSNRFIRYEPAGGDLSNYEWLTDTEIGNSNPFTLYLVNNRIDSSDSYTSLYLSSDSITTWVGCAKLGNEFLYGSEITVNFFSDQKNTEVGFDKFTVELECNTETSTSSQSVMPKLNNTNEKIVYSTLLFLLVSGSIVYYVVKQSSDKKFKYQSIPDSQI